MSTEPNDPDDRPWELPGAIRYDCPPHRGDLLVFLGKFCLFFGVVALLLFPVAFFAIFGGCMVSQLAVHDLMRIQAGEIDPRGDGPIRRAKKFAELGIVLGGASLFLAPFVLVAIVIVLVAVNGGN